MIFLANRANLDKRMLLTRLHNRLQTQVSAESGPVEQVWYHPSLANKVSVRATIDALTFLGGSYPVETAELQVSFDSPHDFEYDFYKIQWVEEERNFMVGWHQDETHSELGECHFQIDCQGETIERAAARFLDSHPLNVFDQRTDHLVEILESITWENGLPAVPEQLIR